MSLPDEERRPVYLARVAEREAFFDQRAAQLTRQYQRLLVASVVLAGATPLFVLVTSLPKVIQALPAALASMATAIAAIYAYPGRIAPYGRARDEIQEQRVRFENGLAPYDGEDALNRFVERIEQIISTASGEGRSALVSAPSGRHGDSSS